MTLGELVLSFLTFSSLHLIAVVQSSDLGVMGSRVDIILIFMDFGALHYSSTKNILFQLGKLCEMGGDNLLEVVYHWIRSISCVTVETWLDLSRIPSFLLQDKLDLSTIWRSHPVCIRCVLFHHLRFQVPPCLVIWIQDLGDALVSPNHGTQVQFSWWGELRSTYNMVKVSFWWSVCTYQHRYMDGFSGMRCFSRPSSLVFHLVALHAIIWCTFRNSDHCDTKIFMYCMNKELQLHTFGVGFWVSILSKDWKMEYLIVCCQLNHPGLILQAYIIWHMFKCTTADVSDLVGRRSIHVSLCSMN